MESDSVTDYVTFLVRTEHELEDDSFKCQTLHIFDPYVIITIFHILYISLN
jgi:hypothetical protein